MAATMMMASSSQLAGQRLVRTPARSSFMPSHLSLRSRTPLIVRAAEKGNLDEDSYQSARLISRLETHAETTMSL